MADIYDHIGEDLGKSTSYAYYVAEGGTKTPQEYGEMLVNIDTVATRAEEAAGQAAESASSAEQSKNSAEASANAAAASQSASAASATRAENKAGEAEQSAGTASEKAEATSIDAETARRMAEQAAASAGTASGHAANAKSSADAAALSKAGAETAKTDAEAAKDGAVTAKDDAEQAKADAQEIADGIQAESDQIDQNTADIAELQEEAEAGNAKQLLSKNTTVDAVPYHFRATGGNGADREYVDAIVGGTVNFNQIYNVTNDSTRLDVNIHVSNGNVVITGTSTGSGSGATFSWTSFKVPNGHKVVVQKDFTLPTGDFIFEQYNGFGNQDVTNRVVNVTNGYLIPQLQIASSGVTYNITGHLSVFDLTQMFGSTVADYIYNLDQSHAGDGVAFFKSLFPNDYYPYNAGELVSVRGLSAHKMVGFNQWDEEWEPGDYRYRDGEPYASSSIIRSKTNNYIPVIPGASYYFNTSGKIMDVYYYDNNKVYTGAHVTRNNQALIMPKGVHFIRFSVPGTTYNHDICINLSDPAKNGTYEPYKAHSYPLDSTVELRGLFKLDANNNLYADGDTYDADGTVTRKRRRIVIDGNTYKAISVSLNNGVYYTVLNAFTSDTRAVDSGTGTKRIITDAGYNDYPAVGIGNIYITGNGLTTVICLFDQSLTDVTSVNNYFASHPIVMEYELATPTTEEATPYRQLQICDPYGTEEFVSTGIVPVGHETRYPDNLRAKIDGLPWDFSSIIAPTEKTTTASRNYTAGSLLIMGNVLYKVTANIANGGTITPNTNVTSTTLSEILSAMAQ